MNEINPFLDKVRAKHNAHFIINKKTFLGHVVTIGDIGQSKSSINSKICELLYDSGYKIFELYTDPPRMDNAYWAFPSDEPFWKVPKVDGKSIVTKRGYPMTILYPISKKTPTMLPSVAKPFTIPINTLDEYDFAALIGADINDSIRQIWNGIRTQINKNTTPVDFLELMTELVKPKKKKANAIKPTWQGAASLKYNIFLPLINEALISSGNCATALNLADEIRDKFHISVLSLKHVPQPLHGFIVHWFIHHINQLSGSLGVKCIIKLNEAPDILKKAELGVPSASIAISAQIANIFKKGRTSNLYFMVDAQDPKELPDIKNTATTVICCRTSFISDIKEMTGFSPRSGSITQDELLCIPFLKRGEAFVFRREDEKAKWVKFIWCRHRMWKTGEDFYKMWDKLNGNWKNVKQELNIAINEIRSSETQWKDKKEMEKLREQQRRKILKEKADAEKRRQAEEEERIKEERRIKREEERILKQVEKLERRNSSKTGKEPIEKTELEQLQEELKKRQKEHKTAQKQSNNAENEAIRESQQQPNDQTKETIDPKISDDLF